MSQHLGKTGVVWCALKSKRAVFVHVLSILVVFSQDTVSEVSQP
jgi:hypothetical protein